MFEDLKALSHHFLDIKNSKYRRYFIQTTKLSHRLSLILGQRGVGKTTTLVQTLLDHVNGDRFDKRILYIQTDHFQVGSQSLYEIAEQFYHFGGEWIAFDEIHKYSNWPQELKSIYDTFPELNVLASGSSSLEIYRGNHDLTRRALSFYMQGLSFREYLELAHDLNLPTFELKDICSNHERLIAPILEELNHKGLKILPEFQQYLKTGYYPYFFEIKDEALYMLTLEQNLHTTLESDLVAIYPHLTGSSIKKIKDLLIFIASSVPFSPNWNNIKSIIDVGDIRTLKTYFSHLEDAGLVKSLHKSTQKISQIESPEKVYLDNPNQLYAISSLQPNKGTLRETFFLNMISLKHNPTTVHYGDFLIDDTYVFEIGGRKKSFNQIKSTKNSFLACDGIESGAGARIPLWLFGFLY